MKTDNRKSARTAATVQGANNRTFQLDDTTIGRICKADFSDSPMLWCLQNALRCGLEGADLDGFFADPAPLMEEFARTYERDNGRPVPRELRECIEGVFWPEVCAAYERGKRMRRERVRDGV